MKEKLLTLIILLLAPSLCRADDRSDLWIVSGQSNACGRAKLPGPAGIPAVRIFDSKKRAFVVAQDPLPGMGTGGVGPWVVAAQRVAKGKRKIDLVGYAKGGAPISFWHPAARGDMQLMSRIATAGKGAGVFLWYQGESNTRRGTDIAKYKDELADLVARVRKAADNPDMTAVIIQLAANTREKDKDRYDFMALREAQRQFVLADTNALLVPALGRSLKDGGHLDNRSQRELGEEIGRALLRTRFGQADVAWPGPVLDAAVLAADGHGVTAHFAEVNKLSGTTPGDFAVIDDAGTAVCRKASASATTVELLFERKITLPGRLVYGFGNGPKATLVDEAGNRAPAVHVKLTTGAVPADEPSNAPNGAGADRP